MPDKMQSLDWRPVLLVKIIRPPFQPQPVDLAVGRAYFALHPDGVVQADWNLSAEQRDYPYVRLVGWKPHRDSPFRLPTQFVRQGSGAALIASGTWVLPYNHTHFTLYRQLQTGWQTLLNQIDAHPVSPAVIGQLIRWTTTPIGRK